MKHRKLRIAWSVAWGVVALMLIVFWVRYWSHLDINRYLDDLENSWPGDTANYKYQTSWTAKAFDVWWIEGERDTEADKRYGLSSPFQWSILPPKHVVSVPHWLTLSAVAAFGIAPWLRWRFSLRTLLIATTLIAVVLGMIVWMSRAG